MRIGVMQPVTAADKPLDAFKAFHEHERVVDPIAREAVRVDITHWAAPE